MVAGDVALWLRALAAFAEDPSSVPSPHVVTTTISDSSSGDPMPSSGLQELWIPMVHFHICRGEHSYTK